MCGECGQFITFDMDDASSGIFFPGVFSETIEFISNLELADILYLSTGPHPAPFPVGFCLDEIWKVEKTETPLVSSGGNCK